MIEFIKKRKKIFIPAGIILVIAVLFLVFRPQGGQTDRSIPDGNYRAR